MSDAPHQKMQNIVLLGGDLVSSIPLPRVLEGFGYGVLSAAEPDDVLYATVTEEVALVIVDLQTPGGGALQLIDTLKQGHEDLSILALRTQDGDDELYLETAERIGADRCLQRPVDLPELHGAVTRELRRALQRAGQQRRAA